MSVIPRRRPAAGRFRPSLAAFEDRTVPTADLDLDVLGPSADLRDGLPPVASDPPLDIPGYAFTNWPAGPLDDIELGVENTFPFLGNGARLLPGFTLGDPYPVRDLVDGTIARVDGWYLVVGLSPPDPITAPPGDGPAVNTYRLAASRDGTNWVNAGVLLAPDDLDPSAARDVTNLFSGSVWWDGDTGRLLVYSSPVFESVRSPAGGQPRQEIALSVATPAATADAFAVGEVEHLGVILRADGELYATPERANTETEVYGFRDPFVFRDPADGRYYMTFTANWGEQRTGYPDGAETGDDRFPDAGPPTIDVATGRPRNDGVVGLAVAADDTLTRWTLRPPVFGGIGVNEQLELPHVVYEGGLYYLFLSTHQRTFVGDLKFQYPEGLYGFYAASLGGRTTRSTTPAWCSPTRPKSRSTRTPGRPSTTTTAPCRCSASTSARRTSARW